MDQELETVARDVGEALLARRLMLVTAESCTGGWTAAVLTSVAGSSQWFERGFVTYSNHAKQQMLGVPAQWLARYGAVSEPVARAMAEGALVRSDSQLALAITGVSGPGGGSAEKPVGTVWLGWSARDGTTWARREHFEGDRFAVRRAAVIAALTEITRYLVCSR